MSQQQWRWRCTTAAIVALALATLGMLTPAWSQGSGQSSASAPYRYVVGGQIKAEELGVLAPLAKKQIAVHQAEVMSADGQLLANFEVAETRDGPVAFGWQPQVDAPLLRLLPLTKEVADLAPVLERHVPKQGRVFAWWDSSRELGLLSGVDMAFDKHLGVPLFLPPQWQKTQADIDSIEADFWKSDADSGVVKAQHKRFQRYVHALLADEKAGVAELQQLAGDKPAAFIVHVRDIILLGQMAPDKIGVAFRDFPKTGDVHGMVRSVRGWVKKQGYPAYALIGQETGHKVRVVALTDEASGQTLAARLLPFIGNNRSTVPGTVLVYRTGGFWVYQLGDTPEEANSND